MNSPGMIVALVLVAVAGVMAALQFRRVVRERRITAQERLLEERLQAAVGTEGTPELERFLRETQLWVLLSRENPGGPVALVLRSPESLSLDGMGEGGEPVTMVEGPPIILCFSSQAAATRFAGTVLGTAVMRQHVFGLLPARDIFRDAIARDARVALNAEGEVRRTFAVEDLRKMVAGSQQDEG